MAHDAARSIASTTGLPFVIDLRDPWGGFERVRGDLTSPLWFTIARYYERLAVRDARLVIMNTDLSRDEMRGRYPDAIERIITVRNGSDDDPIPVMPDSGRFTIRFAGSIYLDRDPRPFFRAAASVARRQRLTPREFGVEFIGEVEQFAGQSVRAIAEQEGFSEFLTLAGPRPRDAAQRFLANATMLLNLPQDADLCVPAKIFEYVRFDSWLLVLAKQRSATAQLLRRTTADVVDPNDIDEIANVIERRYLQHSSGERARAVGHDGRFDRSYQAEILLDRLNASLKSATTSK
jgi:hypothetical protein